MAFKKQNLLPSIILESTAELYRNKVELKSSLIYLVCCISFTIGLIAIFFISVPVSVTSRAIIRPCVEVSQIQSLVNGRLKESFVRENLIVKKGDILYVIEPEMQEEKEKFIAQRKKLLESFLVDLRILNKFDSSTNLNNSVYRQAKINYKHRQFETETRLKKVKADYNRNLKLFQEKVIADAEFENVKFELDKLEDELSLLKQNQISQWHGEILDYEKELHDINTQLAQIEKEKINFIVKAPVSGTIQNIVGAYSGSAVFANQNLAQISPDTTLIVEAYINPADIGLIRTGMLVNFQINAFNYNQWGLATGKVIEVSNDIHFIDNIPVFKLRCDLHQDYLELKNGYKGFLKKGMSLQARFIVTKRTLWQLLYDKTDNWLNPNTFVN
ncbi:MAG: HlyD family efflux transporter periplasmic adaptor subunit [Cyclobacteriaceae bacterium]|nr:HlyD family efflux transporter periplasmic adaptor subunit [Cyclobacteriaceae bacterium]